MERAVLGNAFSLTNDRNCIGVGEGARQGEVVLTFNNGAVKVYNVEDHSCVNTWQLSTSRGITSPASYHHGSRRYWAVQDDTEVVNWLTEDYKSQSVFMNIHELLESKCHAHPLAILKDGRVSVLDETDQSDQTSRSTRQTSKSQVHLSEVIQRGDEELICVVHSLERCASVSVWRVEGGGVEMMSQCRLDMENREMATCCVCGETLVVMDTEGQLSSCSLSSLLNNPPSSSDLSLSPYCKLPSRPITMKSVSRDFFVLADVKEGVVNLSLWDTTYFACQSKTSCPLNQFHSLHCYGGYVLVCGEGVMVCSVRGVEGGGMLAGALGSDDNMQRIPPTLTLTSWGRPDEVPVSQDGTETQQYIATLLDREKTSTSDSVLEAFRSRPLTPGLDYTRVVHRLMEEKEFWAREVVMEIISASLMPQSLSDRLLQTAVTRDDWVVVKAWLETSPSSTAELSIVQLLQSVLNLPDQFENHGTLLTKDQLLRLVLDLPFNDVLMYQPLSQLSFPVVMNLLQFLSSCINVEHFFSDYPHPSTPHTSTPRPSTCHHSYDRYLEWAGLLIDVHFSQLALQPEARQLLSTLRRSVFRQVQCFNNLSVVLQVGGAGGKLMEERTDWQYKIEKMDITV